MSNVSDVNPPTPNSSCDALKQVEDSYYQISPKQLKAVTKDYGHYFVEMINHYLQQPIRYCNSFPDFHLDIDPKYRDSFNFNQLYYASHTVYDHERKKEIKTLVARWKQLRQQVQSYQSNLAPKTDTGKKYQAVCLQLARKRSNLEVLTKQSSPDANAKLYLTKEIATLELTIAELKRQPKQKTERLEFLATDSHLEDLADLEKTHNLIKEKFHMLKVSMTSRPYLYDETSFNGYFLYQNHRVETVYKYILRWLVEGVFSTEESKAFAEEIPSDYFNDVRRVFGNTLLRAGPFDYKPRGSANGEEDPVDMALLENEASLWKASDIVTKFSFTSNGPVYSNHGLAIYRSSKKDVLSLEEPKQHFDNPDQVIIKNLDFSLAKGGGFKVLIMYSYEGNAPQTSIQTPDGVTTMTILRQLKGQCGKQVD